MRGGELMLSRHTTNRCPFCGTPVDGLAADDRTTIDPCGHSAAALTTERLLEQA